MSTKSELQSQESECTSVADWVDLATRALEDPADLEYATELAGKGEMDCQDPADYVALARFYGQKLANTDYVDELLEQAEDACFEPMEYAEVGHAYATLTGNTEKGAALIREAKDSAPDSELLRLSGYARAAGDEELATALFNQATEGLSDIDQFVEMATELANSDQIEAAKSLLKSAERHLQSVEDTVSLAAIYTDKLDDQTAARTLLESAEMDCQFPADYTALAKGFVEILNEPDRVDDLLEEAADIAMEGSEFLDVAYGFLDLKQDAPTALEHFRQAVADTNDRSVLQDIAKTAATRLNDSEFARECYEKTASKITNPGDLVKLAVEGWDTLGDPDYTKTLFEQAREKLVNANELIALAESVVQTLNDTELVRSIYQDAGTQVDSFSGVERILTSQRATVEDAALTLTLVERMQTLADSCAELIKAFDAAQTGELAPEFCRDILTAAEDRAASPGDLEAVIAAVQKFATDDQEWLTSLADKLARRQANQAKYAEIQAQQKQASSALEFMRLARRVISELDDGAYARKLIDEGLEGLDEQNFDVSLWLMAIEIAAIDLDDIELVKTITRAATSGCTHFSSAYVLARKLNESLKPPHRTALVGEILSDWDARLSAASDRIKLAKAVIQISDDIEWAVRIIDSLDTTSLDLLQLAQLGELAEMAGQTDKAREFFMLAVAGCETTSDLTRLMHRLQTGGADESHRKDLYQAGRDRLADATERLRWTEGILLHFDDQQWAKAEYDRLDSEVPDEVLRAAFAASRRQRLEKRFY